MKLRAVGPSILVLLGTTLVLLLASEGLVRVLRVQGSLFTRFDAEVGWAHRPDTRGWYVSPGVKAPVAINAQGLMGPANVSPEKPAGTKRLLLLGDSFTESEQVPFEQTWGYLLDQSLGEEWEVLNAGVAGYGTDNALLWFRTRGRQFDPDAVLLLFFTGNDVSDNDRALGMHIGSWQPQPYFELADPTSGPTSGPATDTATDTARDAVPDATPDGRPALVLHDFPLPPEANPEHSLLGRAKQSLRRHSMLYLFVHERIHRVRALQRQMQPQENRSTSPHRVPLTWHAYRTPPDADWERAFALTDALLQQMAHEVRATGAAFFVAIMPTGWRIDPIERGSLFETYPALRDTTEWDFLQVDRRVESALRQVDVPTLNLTGPLLAAQGLSPEPAATTETTEPTGPGDRPSPPDSDQPLFIDHLSERGHRVVAAALESFLRRESVLP